MTTSDISFRVDRGINWLNFKYPNWLELVDEDFIDMSAAGHCVLSQVAGSDSWSGTLSRVGLTENECAKLGFQTYYSDDEADEDCGHAQYKLLTEEWKSRIEAAREANAQSQPAPIKLYSLVINGRTDDTLHATWPAILDLMSHHGPQNYDIKEYPPR